MSTSHRPYSSSSLKSVLTLTLTEERLFVPVADVCRLESLERDYDYNIYTNHVYKYSGPQRF
jgi:hypothetical protein